MKLLYLREKIPWFGGHSGYEQLTRHIPSGESVSVIKPRSGLAARYLGSSYARIRGRIGRGATSLGEMEFRLQRSMKKPQASHILYLENHFEMLESWSRTQKNLVGTIHLPQHIWKSEQGGLLSRLGGTVVLYQRDIPFFEKFAGKGRVKFIHHGAETEFFRPDPSRVSNPPRLLYSGVYLRNELMLTRIIPRIHAKWPDVQFDLLVPKHHRDNSNLKSLINHPAVTWHAGLNDEQLRDLYQRSYLMLLPMNASGANTAVVEALTSGLPLVTTDVGGVRDYGGGEIFPVVSNDDDDAMLALVDRYLENAEWRHEISRECRDFTEKKMAWPIVAQKHLEFYRELCT